MNQQIQAPRYLKHALQTALILWTVCMGALTLILFAVDTSPVFTMLNGVLFVLGMATYISLNWRLKIERVTEPAEPEFTYTANVSIPKPSTSIYGYVYIMKDISHTGQYKIGRSIHPGERLNMFAVKLPIETKVIHVIACEDYIKAESMLHDVFAEYRGRGEWFTLNDSQVLLLKSIKKL
jgi:hypothetical protein